MATPQEDFGQWMDEHYDVTEGREIRCRRCSKAVGYLTKHAVKRHGDNIDVMPAVNRKLSLARAH
jgi:hypothetical protein